MGSGSEMLVVPLSLVFVAVLILMLRWTYSTGHSLVRGPARKGHEEEYGLLVAVASPQTYIEGEMLRRSLAEAGVRANLAETLDGPRIMVFPDDEARARELLRTTGHRD